MRGNFIRTICIKTDLECRLAFGIIAAFLVCFTPLVVANGFVPAYYFVVLIGLYFIHQVNIG